MTRMYVFKGGNIEWDNLLAEINAWSTKSALMLAMEEIVQFVLFAVFINDGVKVWKSRNYLGW